MRAVQYLVVLVLWLLLGGCSGQPQKNEYLAAATGGAGGAPPTGGDGGIELGGFGGAPSCEGDCPAVPEGWSLPALVAVGPYSDLPACPDIAPYPGFEAYADLQPMPHPCAPCLCGPSATECKLPVDWVAAAAKCGDTAGAVQTSLDAAPGWDGQCSEENAVPADAMCNGAPCAQSVTVAAPEALGGPCAPSTAGAAPPWPAPVWARRLRACQSKEPAACPEEPPACRPPTGFALCTHREGDLDCPAKYSHKQLFFMGADDLRACEPCQCGPPEGGACAVYAAVYKEGTCDSVVGSVTVTSKDLGGCFDTPPGYPLSAKTAEMVLTTPGACAPAGGKATGELAPAGPATLCCRDEIPAK